jgi:tRNA-dihydrouridine synthase 2
MTVDDVEAKAQQLYKGAALAPMVRASTTPLRTLALKYGADAVYTEELMDRSLISTLREVQPDGIIDFRRDTTNMPEKTKRKMALCGGGPSIMFKIDPAKERGKLICQLGTGEPNLALQAALHVHRDVDAIDINMGCPKKFSVSGGMGSALLTDPDRAGSIIRTLRQAIPDKPISCKIRLIKDTQTTLDFCTAMINAGALAIGIHARYVDHDSTKPADWKTLREVVPLLKSKFPSVPVMVNGDFYTRQEWTDMMEETGANGVLLSRPALYNTSIFRKPAAEQCGPFGYNSPLLLDKTTVVQDYLREATRYNTHYKNIKYVICEMMTNRRNPPERCPHMPYKFLGGQTIPKTCNCRSLEDLCQVWNVAPESDTIGAEQAPAAGEHSYEDSYFLKDLKKEERHGEERSAKCPRLDSDQRSS